MSDDFLGLGASNKSAFKMVSRGESYAERKLRFDGHNKDIVESYYWFLHFPYYIAKRYTPIKLEDYHYFSENSQFGTQMRQVKGGAIKAFQENLSQLVQLVKVHLMPLLKEVKQSEFYNNWFKQITENDYLVQQELKKPEGERNLENLRKWRRARDEAVNHIKDKWVTEVDGGRMWQINKSSTEQGLDFALLPQLFFGVNLERPLDVETLAEQLEGDIYSIDISNLAREQVARFLWRFHTWLPTAVKESEVTHRVKVSSLKQFYSQIQMYVSFMKPLLIEISKKNEGLDSGNFYKGFEMDNPEVINLFDYSYSFIKLIQIRNFKENGFEMKDLEFSRYGFHIRKTSGRGGIAFGPHAKKTGFLVGEEKDENGTRYRFIEYKGAPDKLTSQEFKELKAKWEKDKVYVSKEDMCGFSVIETDFSQKRRGQVLKTEQGPQQVPYMRNEIIMNNYNWNIYELASFREELKVENLQLLEGFIEEIKVVREDLLKYVNDLEGTEELENFDKESLTKEESKRKEEKKDWTLIAGPFQGLGELFSPLFPNMDFTSRDSKRKIKQRSDANRDEFHLNQQLYSAEDSWKGYNVFKKAHRYIQY